VIFRDYDIRGVVGKDLDSDIVELIGKAFGTYIKGSVAVGRDNRPSSKSLRDALVKGLLSTGCNVVDIGLATSPLVNFSVINFKTAGGVMVTGSHDPKEYNGLKLSKGVYALRGKEILVIKEIAESNNFSKGKGRMRYVNISSVYVNFIKRHIKLKRRLKVVIDCGNGTASFIAPKVFKALGCKVVPLYCTLDSSFPHHIPNPVIRSNLKGLVKKVKSQKADLGLAFDGDADRLGVVDDKGKIYFGDQIMILLSRDILSRKKHAKVVVEIKCSKALIDDIRKHGGIPVISKTGHSNIEAKMREENALLGGEMSGHIFFREGYFGYDDAIYAAARLLGILSGKDLKFSDLFCGVPKYYTSPEIRINCPDDKKFGFVDELKRYFKKKYKVITIDGVKIDFGDGWALVRASNTQPALVLRFEATSKKRLSQIKKVVYSRLR
jgi:phosphomannomutase/phosphoglucomutase